jgi:radical SAM-linked protein
MFKVRLQFSKSGALRFIGHLDFLRVFRQTVRRAGLPMAFSQGFNPHMLISFALPLPLGMESANDYADLTLDSELSYSEITDRINSVAPNGLVIKNAYFAENKAASVVSVADYIVKISETPPSEPFVCAEKAIEKILQSEEIIIAKKTKNGVKETDIREDIFAIEMEETAIKMRLSAGSARFLSPFVVAEMIFGEKPSAAAISRIELFMRNEENELVTL